jgi:hypothetical protein
MSEKILVIGATDIGRRACAALQDELQSSPRGLGLLVHQVQPTLAAQAW